MKRNDPYRGYRFRVEIDDLQQGGFQSVSGLERQSQLVSYQEGGVNDYEHQFIVKTTYPPLALKRGLFDPVLWDWHQSVISGKVERRNIAVVLLTDDGSEAWRWVCADAFPMKWSGGTLDASSNGIASESIDFVHRGVTKV